MESYLRKFGYQREEEKRIIEKLSCFGEKKSARPAEEGKYNFERATTMSSLDFRRFTVVQLNAQTKLKMFHDKSKWQRPEYSLDFDINELNITGNNEQLGNFIKMIGYFSDYQFYMLVQREKYRFRAHKPIISIKQLRELKEDVDFERQQLKDFYRQWWVYLWDCKQIDRMKERFQEYIIIIMNSNKRAERCLLFQQLRDYHKIINSFNI